MASLGWLLPFSLIGSAIAVSVISHAGSEGGHGYRKWSSPPQVLKGLHMPAEGNGWKDEPGIESAISQNNFPESTASPPLRPLKASRPTARAFSLDLSGGGSSPVFPTAIKFPPLADSNHLPDAQENETERLFEDENISLDVEVAKGQVDRAAIGSSSLPLRRQDRPLRGRPGPKNAPPRFRRPVNLPPTRSPERRPQQPPRHPDISVIPLQSTENEDSSSNLLSERFPPFTDAFPPLAAPFVQNSVPQGAQAFPVAAAPSQPASTGASFLGATTPIPSASPFSSVSPSIAAAFSPAGPPPPRLPGSPEQLPLPPFRPGFGQRPRFHFAPAQKRPLIRPGRQRKPPGPRRPKAPSFVDQPPSEIRQFTKDFQHPRGHTPPRRIRPSARTSSFSTGETLFQKKSNGGIGAEKEAVNINGRDTATFSTPPPPQFPKFPEYSWDFPPEGGHTSHSGVKQKGRGTKGHKGTAPGERGKRPGRGQRLSILQAVVRDNLPSPEEISVVGQRIRKGLGKLAGDVAAVTGAVGQAAGHVLGESVVAVGNAGNAVIQAVSDHVDGASGGPDAHSLTGGLRLTVPHEGHMTEHRVRPWIPICTESTMHIPSITAPQFGLQFNLSSNPHSGGFGGLLPVMELGIDSEVSKKPLSKGQQYAFLEPYAETSSGPSPYSSHFDDSYYSDGADLPDFPYDSDVFFEETFGDGLEEHFMPEFHQVVDDHLSYQPSHFQAPQRNPTKLPCRPRRPYPPPPPGLLPIPIPSSFRPGIPYNLGDSDCPPSRPGHHDVKGEFPFSPRIPTSQFQESTHDNLPHKVDVNQILREPFSQANVHTDSIRDQQVWMLSNEGDEGFSEAITQDELKAALSPTGETEQLKDDHVESNIDIIIGDDVSRFLVDDPFGAEVYRSGTKQISELL